MAKSNKKNKHSEKNEKHQKDKHQKGVPVTSSVSETPTAATMAAYADGEPLDSITYLEAKLILKPDRFTSVQSFRDFGKIVRQTATKVGAGFIRSQHRTAA